MSPADGPFTTITVKQFHHMQDVVFAARDILIEAIKLGDDRPCIQNLREKLETLEKNR